jgi:Protein of unknown function (DUF3137)
VTLVMLAGFLLFGVCSILALKHRGDRGLELARLAEANGFFFSEVDQWACTRVPFQTFRLGNEGFVENVCLGQAPDDAPVRVFDYTCWEETQTDQGTQRTRYHHLTCCLTETHGSLPHLVLQPETLATRFLGKIGMPDLDFESEEFNRRFVVTSEDERFARLFVDPRMMELLLSTDGQFQFEVMGRWVLVAAPQLPAKLCLSLVNLSTAFRECIAPVVWEYYPQLVPGTEP